MTGFRYGSTSLMAAIIAVVIPSCGSSQEPGHTDPIEDAAAGGRDSMASVGWHDAASDLPGDGAAFYPADGGSAIVGTVLDFGTFRPLADRRVSIGSRTATTDGQGRFTLIDIPATYDVVVRDREGSTISVYRGLSRRDPVLPHKGLPPPATQTATVRGDVSGVGKYPLAAGDFVDFYFFSELADNGVSIGGASESLGPGYGPLRLTWGSAQPISGRFVAFGTFGEGSSSFGFFDQPLTLAAGQSAVVNVALTPVTATHHISGTIQLPRDSGIALKGAFHKLPMIHATIELFASHDPSSSFDYLVPDLSRLGGQLCVAAASSPQLSVTQRCGLSVGQKEIALILEPAPTLVTPTAGLNVTRDTRFEWTAFGGGVHLLELEPTIVGATSPNIYVFTAGTSVGWPEIESLGVSFPAGARYGITVVGLGPHATLDESLGQNGLVAPSPVELRRSYSQTSFSSMSL